MTGNERPITAEELELLHLELDWYDRQDSIENILSISDDIKLQDSPTKMYDAIQEIKSLCLEYCG